MKEFNITGTCIPHKHYMVNTGKKIEQISRLIEKGKYFIISRPRQFGKTTTLYLLENFLKDKYLLISTSFEGVGDSKFESEENFSSTLFNTLSKGFIFENDEFKEKFSAYGKNLKSLEDISNAITKFAKDQQRKIVLMIDEVDKASNHRLFLNFLGMLRNKFLQRDTGRDFTFHSVILAGVHDIKNIKLKMRPDEEKQFNSPWNIAADFDVDMSFSPEEISTMLVDYEKENHTGMNVLEISNEIHKFTSGYPFLVSKICKLIDEKLDRDWSHSGIQKAVTITAESPSALTDDLIKNIENNKELESFIFRILVQELKISFVHSDQIISYGAMFGILKADRDRLVSIDNKIFEIILYNHLIAKLDRQEDKISDNNFYPKFIDSSGNLDMEKILLKFQQFIKENYSSKDDDFYERQGRLLLIAFIKPIINGTGFYYLESQRSYEKRTDMIITFNRKEYILELKLWHGMEYHRTGLRQLAGYLETKNHDKGYLVAFNFSRNKEFTSRWNEVDGKKIFEVLV